MTSPKADVTVSTLSHENFSCHLSGYFLAWMHIPLLIPLAIARSPRDVVFTESSRSGPPPTFILGCGNLLTEKHPKQALMFSTCRALYYNPSPIWVNKQLLVRMLPPKFACITHTLSLAALIFFLVVCGWAWNEGRHPGSKLDTILGSPQGIMGKIKSR